MPAQRAGWCRNTELKAVFDALAPEAKADVGMLEEIIKTRVGIDLDPGRFGLPQRSLRYLGNLKARQYPNELAQFLSFLHARRSEVRSYLEIGVHRCGTFYTVDSYLRSVNPAFGRSTAVDVVRRWCGFRAYQAVYDCRFCKTPSSAYAMDEPVDLVLIDGDHRLDAVAADFELVRRKARYVALHDTASASIWLSGVKTFWKQIKDDYEHFEFLNQDPDFPDSLGIGVIVTGVDAAAPPRPRPVIRSRQEPPAAGAPLRTAPGTSTRDRVTALIAHAAHLSPDQVLDAETPLVGAGLSLDSVAVLELLVALENEFRVELREEELLDTDALETVATLVAFMDARLAEGEDAH